MSDTYRPGQLYTGRDGDLLFVILPSDDVEFVTNRGTRLPLAEVDRVYAPLTLVRDVNGEPPAYPAPGSDIPDQPGYVVGRCGHRLAASEWRAGFRTCERCGSDWEDQGNGADMFACAHLTTDEPGHDNNVCPRITEAEWQAIVRGEDVKAKYRGTDR